MRGSLFVGVAVFCVLVSTGSAVALPGGNTTATPNGTAAGTAAPTTTATPTAAPTTSDGGGDGAIINVNVGAGTDAPPGPGSGSGSTSTPSTATDARPALDGGGDCSEYIDNHTALCSTGYDSRTGQATVTLYSDRPARVTLTDAGGVFAGGEINRKRATLTEGSKTTVRLRVTEHRGFVGLTVDTGRTLYGVPIEQGGGGSTLPEFPRWATLLLGVSLTAVGTVGYDKYQSRKESEGVTRIEG